MPAAWSSERRALMVRPCRPMTLPMSACATRTSMMVVRWSRFTSRTSTSSGSCASALTINSTASFIVRPLSEVDCEARTSSTTGRGQTLGAGPGARFRRLRLGVGLNQLPHGVGRLRALPHPVVDALHVEAHLGGLARRVVEADVLDVGAVALRQTLLDDDAVRRRLLRAHSHE